jgi:two-component system, cell cycle sensor histidine kinase and response regulator CckA
MTFDPANIDMHAEELASLRRQVQVLEDRIAHLTAEQDRKDKTLRDNEAKLRQVIDLVPHFIFAKDRQGRFILVNKAVADAYGTSVENLIGKSDADFNPNREEVAHFLKDDLQVIDNGIAIIIPEEKITDARGKVRFLQTTKIPFHLSSTGAEAILGVSTDITGLKTVELTLEEREHHFHAILQNLSDMIFIFDKEGLITFATPSAAKGLGYAEQFLIGLNPFTLIHPDDLPLVKEAFKSVVFSTNTGIPTIFRLRKADGSWAYLETIGQNLLAHPTIHGIVISARDISQRIDIQEKWYESLAVNRALIDAMHNAAVLMDTEGRILAANRFVATALKKEVRELVGDNFYNCLPPEWLSVWTEHLQKVKETGRSSRFERIINDRYFHNDIHPIFDKEGKLIQISIFQYEITRYKKAEKRIKAEQHFLRQIIDAVPAFIGVRDAEGRYELANVAVADAYGTTVENIIGKTDIELKVPVAEAERFLNDDREVIQTGTSKYIVDEKCTYGDGSLHWLSTYKVPLIDSKGGCSRILAVAMDRTHLKETEEEREKLQDQLLQSQKMEAIGSMSSGMAHDFNNILMGIQGFVSLLLYELSADHPHRSKLESIELYIKRGAELTRQLLGFAQGGKYDVKPTNLNAFLEKSVEMFSRTRKEIWIHRRFEEQLWNVEIDQGQMDQVFLNLFINASQAMAEGGNLYLETRNVVFQENEVKPVGIHGGKYIKLSITDEGVGMEKEVLDRIFEPFFTTKPKGVGTGLGLASAYGIIKNHKGVIHAYSEKGKGTTFSIYLPSSDKLPQTEEEQEHHLAAGTETILIVDDEQMNIVVIREMLEMLGYNIYAAGSGQEALAIYSERGDEIDLVVMDMIMPGIGGGKTFDYLKGINPNVKVILASGYSVNGEARSIMERGCLDFIQKPFQLHELTGRIRKVLDAS